MMKFHPLALATLVVALAPYLILGEEIAGEAHEKRQVEDSFTVFNRLRNGHACIMSIVFIVLYPLGAISLHLPIERIPYVNRTYLRNKVTAIHAPIQLLGLVMSLGGMALGIRLALNLNFFTMPLEPHVVIGLIVVPTIFLFQPAFGFLQHRYYKKTGGKSPYAYLHRWIGRLAIILAWINNGLGFQIAQTNVIVPTHSYIRNYVILGVLMLIWLFLVLLDHFKPQWKDAILPAAYDNGPKDEMKSATGPPPYETREAPVAANDTFVDDSHNRRT